MTAGGEAFRVRAALHCMVVFWWSYSLSLSVFTSVSLSLSICGARGAYHCIALGFGICSLVCGYTDRGYPFAIY
jgi:hypothetical protein